MPCAITSSVCERDNAGLLREEAITLEDVEREAPWLARCRALLAELEAHNVDALFLIGRGWR